MFEDEDIIVKAATVMSTFRIMFILDRPFIERSLMDRLLQKNMEDLFNRISEDDESLLKLTKDIGKIYYCINKFYPCSFEAMRTVLASFYLKHVSNEEDF